MPAEIPPSSKAQWPRMRGPSARPITHRVRWSHGGVASWRLQVRGRQLAAGGAAELRHERTSAAVRLVRWLRDGRTKSVSQCLRGPTAGVKVRGKLRLRPIMGRMMLPPPRVSSCRMQPYGHACAPAGGRFQPFATIPTHLPSSEVRPPHTPVGEGATPA